jgi:hypothetical protein
MAAEHGYPAGMAGIARLYEKGLGVPRNFVNAYAWTLVRPAFDVGQTAKENAVRTKGFVSQLNPTRQLQAKSLAKALKAKIDRVVNATELKNADVENLNALPE